MSDMLKEEKTQMEDKVERLPIDRKLVLTVKEAAEYSNMGVNLIIKLAKEPGCPFVLKNGNRHLIKREEFEAYIKSRNEIN